MMSIREWFIHSLGPTSLASITTMSNMDWQTTIEMCYTAKHFIAVSAIDILCSPQWKSHDFEQFSVGRERSWVEHYQWSTRIWTHSIDALEWQVIWSGTRLYPLCFDYYAKGQACIVCVIAGLVWWKIQARCRGKILLKMTGKRASVPSFLRRFWGIVFLKRAGECIDCGGCACRC